MTRNVMPHTFFESTGGHEWKNWRLYLNTFAPGSDDTQDEENRRISAIADELERLCAIHEAQFRAGQANVNSLEIEQRMAEQIAKSQGFWIPMMDVFNLGIPGHFTKGIFEAWDLVPRNVLADNDDNIYVVDAEIKQIGCK